MRVTTIILLAVLVANAQSTRKAAGHNAAPTAPQMSHDFRTAGRRALNAIDDLARSCTKDAVCPSIDAQRLEEKADNAIGEADAQHDNAIDKRAVELLRLYNTAVYVVAKDGSTVRQWRTYSICKKEAEEAFETGLLPKTFQCKAPSD